MEELEQGVGGYYMDGKKRSIPMESLMREVQYAKRDGKDMDATLKEMLAPYDAVTHLDYFEKQLKDYWQSDESSRIMHRM